MKTIETINTLCKKDVSLYRAHLDQTADYVRRNPDEIAAEIEAEQKAKAEQEREDEGRRWPKC